MSKHHEKSHASSGGSPAGEPKVHAGVNEASEAGPDTAGQSQEKPASESATSENAAPSIEIELKARIASLEAENSNLKDQYLRKAAEFENFRKRMTKDKQDAIDFANQTLLLDIIPVIDDFERAIKSSDGSSDIASFREGISMIEKRLVSQLEAKWGLVRFESTGSAFDPNRHEAIMMEKSPDVAEATVAEDFVRGYTLKDRVVRSAKVKVLMPSDEPKSAEPADDATIDGKN